MSVLSFVANDRFVVRILKSHENNADNLWSNSYELIAIDDAGGSELLTSAMKIVAFEKALHMVPIDFHRLLISTWEPDSVPYDPLAFMSIPLIGSGTIGEVNGMLPINVCASVGRVVSSGRIGHVFYRGALDQAEVDSLAGKLDLIDATEYQGKIDDAIAASSVDDLFETGGDSLHMVMIQAAGGPVRTVQGFAAVGVATLPTDHAWFNRTTGP